MHIQYMYVYHRYVNLYNIILKHVLINKLSATDLHGQTAFLTAFQAV